MRNIQENEVQQNNKLIGIAAILSSLPKGVYYSALFIMFTFTGIAIWYHHDSLESFVNDVLIGLLLVVCTSLLTYYVRLGYRAFIGWNKASIVVLERQKAIEQLNKARLNNFALQTEIESLRLKPQLLLKGLENGFNIEYKDVKLSDWRSNMHMLGNGQVPQIGMPNIILPSKSEMIEVARRHDFSKDNIFLAQSNEGDVTTSVRGYLHCANDGSTDSGKTSNWRGQLTQFVKAGIDCILLNPNFCLVTKDGQDWKPIARALEGQGNYELELPRVVTQFININAVLYWLAKVEIDRRFQMMREGCFDYNPLYAYIDEWPSISTECKEASEYLKLILQRGRAVEVCVSVNSQGFLKDDTDLKGSARENFATAFFLGGSTYSGAKMLDISEKTLREMLEQCQEPIGKGVAFLRNNTSLSNAQIVRLPYADNDFLYHCLGRADSYRLPPENIVESPVSQDSNDDLDRVYEACMQIKDEGKKPSARSVEAITGINRTTCNRLLGVLETQGLKVR